MFNKSPLPPFSLNKKNIKYALLVVILYGVFLVSSLPAYIVVSSIKMPNNLKFSSVSGTVWSGKLDKLEYSGIHIGTLSWELNPMHLLIGEISANVLIANKDQHFDSKINLSSSGKIELEDTRFQFNLSSLQPLTYGMPFSYSGQVSGYFPVSFFYKNNYIGINGKLILKDIQMISPQRQTFGDFDIDFRAEQEGATSGKIKDNGGLLNVDGELTLSKNGNFNIEAKLAAREKNSELERVISFLGRKDAAGRFLLNSNFKLWH